MTSYISHSVGIAWRDLIFHLKPLGMVILDKSKPFISNNYHQNQSITIIKANIAQFTMQTIKLVNQAAFQ